VGSLSTVTWLSGQPHQRTRLRAALAATVWAQNAAEDHSAFAAFNRFDYRRRGLMSGEIAADLMLSLHHNMCKYTYLNRVAAFIPGAVTPSEAKQAGFAFFAFRRALEGDLPLLTELARSIAQHMQDELGVSAHQRPGKPDSPRLDIDAAGGVFARNLAVLRRATGPVVLIEGPCMNHPAEYRRLTRQELTIDGLPLPDRVREYAAAVDAALQPHVAALWQQRARRRQSEVAFGKTTTSTGR
jgi:N-acetylmuramoyl-L-alanine amidase